MQLARRFTPRRALIGLALVLVLPGAMCSSKDPATMDRKEIAKLVLQEGAMEVFKGKATGSIVSGIAAMPETAKGLLIADLRAERDRLEQEAFVSNDARLDARANWVQANLDCIASDGKNCSYLQKLMAQRKAAQAAAAPAPVTGEGGEGHSD